MGELPEGLLEEALKDFNRLVPPLLRYFPYAEHTMRVITDVTSGSVCIIQFPFRYFLSEKMDGLYFILCSKSFWDKHPQEEALELSGEWPGVGVDWSQMWYGISHLDEGDVEGLERILRPLASQGTFECLRGLPIYRETLEEIRESPEEVLKVLEEDSFKAFVAKDFLGVT